MKMSGIGCSSKSPAYFMTPLASASTPCTDACRRSRPARCWPTRPCARIGVSGDGDTASIGMGQFVHLVRRNVPDDLHHRRQRRVWPDQGPVLRHRRHRLEAEDRRHQRSAAIDICALAIQLGATFVGRSFSGDKKQLSAMLKAAHRAPGNGDARRDLALRHLQRPRRFHQELQVHAGARRAVARGRLRAVTSKTSRSSTIPTRPSTCAMHDGSHLRLRKLHEDYDPDRQGRRHEAADGSRTKKDEVLTGVFYVEHAEAGLHRAAEHGGRAAGHAAPERTRPSREVLAQMMELHL